MLWPTRTIRSNAESEPSAVELPPHLIQVAAEQGSRMRDRVARRVAESPELIAIADGRFGLQAFSISRGPTTTGSTTGRGSKTTGVLPR